ncbi:MAG: hypothetical protein ACO3IB_02115, partial [Phycisphaerales bacterium]
MINEACDSAHGRSGQLPRIHAIHRKAGLPIMGEDSTMEAPVSEPLRILHAIDHLDFRRGGPPHALVALANALGGLGHEVLVATPDGPDTPRDWYGS